MLKLVAIGLFGEDQTASGRKKKLLNPHLAGTFPEAIVVYCLPWRFVKLEMTGWVPCPRLRGHGGNFDQHAHASVGMAPVILGLRKH